MDVYSLTEADDLEFYLSPGPDFKLVVKVGDDAFYLGAEDTKDLYKFLRKAFKEKN